MLGTWDGLQFDFEICFAACLPDSLVPVRNVNVIYEVGKSMTTYRHDFREFLVD